MRKSSVLFSAFLFCSIANGQQDSTLSKNLDEVVVTGQYKPQTAKSAVYQVRSISKERIQKQAATRLQDVLNNELNIRFSQDLPTGGSGITMMGLKGQNVKILMDGLPLTGRQGVSNEIDINQIDINSIERIEIVEGPMSVVYGADALAGVINIITKKASSAKLSVKARLHEETIGNEYGIKKGIHNQSAGADWRYRNWDIGVGFAHNYFGGWKDSAADRELVWHKKDQRLINGFLGYSKNRATIRYRIDGLDEIITNPGNFLFPQQSSADTLAYDQEYLTQRVMHQLQGSYFHTGNLNFQLQSSYSKYSRQVFSTTVSKKTGDIRLNIAPGAQSQVDFTGLTLRGLANYKVSPVFAFQPGIDINLDRGEGEKLKSGSNKINDYAFFVTAEITPTTKVSIRPGIRMIRNSVYDAPPVIPSLNARFAITKKLDLRMAFAKGFRSPSLRELYFNFFDANHQIRGNPDLKAETSNSLSSAINWKKISRREIEYTAVISAFFNDVKNLIDYAVSATDPNLFVLSNVSDSKTAGINVNAGVKYSHLNLDLGAGYTGFYNEHVQQDESLPSMQWSAEINLNAGYTFSKLGLDLNFFYKFTGKRPFYVLKNQVYLEAETKGYHMADLVMNKKLSQRFMLNAGIRNLFNVDRITSTVTSGGIHSSDGVRNIANGRSFLMGINFNVKK